MATKHSKGAGNVTRMEQIDTGCMEARMSGDSVIYVEKNYTGNAWMCNACGLVWEKRHQAEGCRERGHQASYTDTYYGRGYVENGVFKGSVQKFERRAIRREKPSQARVDAIKAQTGMSHADQLDVLKKRHNIDRYTVNIKTSENGLHDFLVTTGYLFSGRFSTIKFSSITPEDVRAYLAKK